MVKLLAFFFLLYCPLLARAEPITWHIDPEKSRLIFTAIQNNVPVKGDFTHLAGEIVFDIRDVEKSHAKIVVQMDSVRSSYEQVATTLKTPDWFDVESFPRATWVSKKFVQVGDNQYEAKGMLTIRNKAVPVDLTFVIEQYTEERAKAKGTATLKRTDFNVGKGEWRKTDAVKDEVKIEFLVSAIK